MLSRPVILIYVVSKTVVIFPPDHQLYLLPLFGDYPPLPFPFDDGCPPSLLMSTPPLIITPPWSTNSVPCHPISRHTVLSGREGEGRTMQNVIAKLFPPVDTNNTYTQTRAPANTVIFLFSMPSILINCIHQHASSSYVIRELKVQHDFTVHTNGICPSR